MLHKHASLTSYNLSAIICLCSVCGGEVPRVGGNWFEFGRNEVPKVYFGRKMLDDQPSPPQCLIFTL